MLVLLKKKHEVNDMKTVVTEVHVKGAKHLLDIFPHTQIKQKILVMTVFVVKG